MKKALTIIALATSLLFGNLNAQKKEIVFNELKKKLEFLIK